MPKDDRDILELLKGELEFIEKGGYGVTAQSPALETSTVFRDSLVCLNYGYPYRIHPCKECPLIGFVPPEKQSAGMPCHQIPLDPSGNTLEALEQAGDKQAVREAVKGWLRQAIRRVESERLSQRGRL